MLVTFYSTYSFPFLFRFASTNSAELSCRRREENQQQKQREKLAPASFGYGNVSVKLSRSEFHQAAIKYGIKTRTCNIKISSRNFTKFNDTTMVTSIGISRSHFQGNENVIVPINPVPVNAVTQINPVNQSNHYKFRVRKRKPENSLNPPAKRSRALVVRNDLKPKLIVANKDLLSEGQIVLAKMRTYAAWPATIKSFGKSNINVHFLGDETTGNVLFENVGFYQENYQLIKINLQKKICGYPKAVRCAEVLLNIPDHLSMLSEN